MHGAIDSVSVNIQTRLHLVTISINVEDLGVERDHRVVLT